VCEECVCCIRSLFQSVFRAFSVLFRAFLERFSEGIQEGWFTFKIFICLNVILMRVSLFLLIFVECGYYICTK